MSNTIKRHLQFRRNEEVYPSYEVALEAMKDIPYDNIVDGEQLLARYYYTLEEDGDAKTKVATMVGYVYKTVDKDNGTVTTEITVSDPTQTINDIQAAINELESNSMSGVKVQQERKAEGEASYDENTADKYGVYTKTNDGEFPETTDVSFNLKFTPYSPSSLTVPVAFGDIAKGTTASDLSKMTLSKVIDDMLFKTIYPTITSTGGATIVNSKFGTNETHKVGQDILSKVAVSNFSTTLNRGWWKILDGVAEHETQKSYLGEKTTNSLEYKYDRAASTNVVDPNLSDAVVGSYTSYTSSLATIKPGTYMFKGTVNYSANSVSMYDSKGVSNNPQKVFASTTATTTSTVTNPVPSGSKSAEFTLNVTLPVYVNSGSTENTEFKELPLQKWGAMTWGTDGNKPSGVQFPPTEVSDGKKIVIKTPRKIASFKGWDSTSSNFSFDYTSNFAETEETIDGVKYKVYTWNSGAVGYSNYYQIKIN